jgi:RNA polymerase sigma-70 factor (ECF subfamily)
VAINHSLDYLRRKRLPTTPMSIFLAEDTGEYGSWGNKQVAQNQNPEEQLIHWQKRMVIEGHLGALPAPLRDVAQLRFVEAYSYEEIAGKLRMPMGTVKAHIHRSRLLLQKSLKPLRSQS